MRQLLLIFNISALLLMNACGNIPQNAADNAVESTPSASSSSEATVLPSAPTESITATSSIVGITEEKAVGEGRTDIEEAQILYKDYFATEIQWQGTYLSGDEQYQLGSEAPYDTTETRYSYSVTPEGAVLRQQLKRDPVPDAGCSRYAPISNLVVQVYSPANDSYLLNFQTKDSRLVAAEDVDEIGQLRYEIKQ